MATALLNFFIHASLISAFRLGVLFVNKSTQMWMVGFGFMALYAGPTIVGSTVFILRKLLRLVQTQLLDQGKAARATFILKSYQFFMVSLLIFVVPVGVLFILNIHLWILYPIYELAASLALLVVGVLINLNISRERQTKKALALNSPKQQATEAKLEPALKVRKQIQTDSTPNHKSSSRSTKSSQSSTVNSTSKSDSDSNS